MNGPLTIGLADAQTWLAKVVYAQTLGITARLGSTDLDEDPSRRVGTWVEFNVSPAPHLLGDLHLPSFHGGIVLGLLELRAQCEAELISKKSARLISSNIDYLRPAFFTAEFQTRVTSIRVGRTISVVRAEALQTPQNTALQKELLQKEKAHTIAVGVFHFREA